MLVIEYALLQDVEAGVGCKVVIEVASVVPYVNGRGQLLPCLDAGIKVAELGRGLEVVGHGQVHSANYHADVIRQLLGGTLAGGDVGSSEEHLLGEAVGQAYNHIGYGRRGVVSCVACRCA